MLKKKINYFIIFFITITFFILKYSYSLIYFKEDFLITKILIETGDIQYYPVVESLSKFQLNPSFSNHLKAEKILTFPFFSLIWHSILFKFFDYYSFIILEFFFKFLTFVILYKIFKKFEITNFFSIFLGLLVLSLPYLFNLFELLNFTNLNLINQLINRNFGSIFPRPLVAFFYLYFFLYVLMCFYINKKAVLILPISILLFLLANSFYIYFITSFLLLFLILIIIFKKNIIIFIRENILILFISMLIILTGPFFVFFQNFYGEPDYSRRIGLFQISFDEKKFLLKYFISSFLRLQIIILFSISFILKFFVKKIFLNDKISNLLNIFFYFFICSIIAPFIFVFFSSKIIHVYLFFDFIILTCFFYIFFFSIIYFYQNIKTYAFRNALVFFFYFFCFFSIFIAHKNHAKNPQINQDTVYSLSRDDINLINNFLLESNYQKSDKILFTNDTVIINLWLFHKNKFLSVPEGFSNSLTDIQIEESLFATLKSLGVDDSSFKEYLDLNNTEGRNFFSTFFYVSKYQANSFKKFSDINHYLLQDRIKILNTSPLRSHSNFLPENEKLDILLRYTKYQTLNNKNLPDIIVLNKKAFIKLSLTDYFKIFETADYIIYVK
jgi:hypothetical protein